MSSEVEQIQQAVNDLVKEKMYNEALLYLEGIEKQESLLKPFADFQRGQVFIAMRDFARARKYFELSFTNEYRIPAAEMIATLLLAEGRLDKCIDFLANTIARETENIRLLRFDLCKFYVISDRYADAERLMGEILPGLAPPLPPGIAGDAPTLQTAIKAEYETLDGFPNLKAFLDLVDGKGFPAGNSSVEESEDAPGS
jgi:tetratricopeptide (TPR) repeat protein